MTTTANIAEYIKHLSVVYKGKSEEQKKDEHEAALNATFDFQNERKKEEAREAVERIEAARKKHKAEVDKSFALLRGRLSVDAALEECENLLDAAEALAAGARTDIPAFVVKLEFLDSENVTDEDAARAEAMAQKGAEIFAALEETIKRNSASIEDAAKRSEGDKSLSAKLKKLEKERLAVLRSGGDIAKMNAEVVKLKEDIEVDHLKKNLAAEDVEVLTGYEFELEARRDSVRAVVKHVDAMASALRCHSMVEAMNAKTRELGEMLAQALRLQRKTWRYYSFRSEQVVCAPRHGCGVANLPLWRGRYQVPDYEGGLMKDTTLGASAIMLDR